ncbi:unnamed protein product [Euphydryas editha]|uniref:Reverse transcriptase domain-containing protein n=1 Tax=Euphydryas editha TaxID=104508 RepID=A0AAU9UBB0_EUPED|nr:unnamed protein product [Euphydryas editha]
MAIKTEIISEHKPDWETVVEDLWVRIRLLSGWINICTVYLPSYLSMADYLDFLNNCGNIISFGSKDKHLILGDFNLGDIDWDNLTGLPQNLLDAKSAALSEFMTSTNLSQLNYVSNQNNRILDLVLASAGLSCSVRKCTEISRIDEHHPAVESCTAELLQIDWGSISDLGCDDFLQQFYNIVWETIDKHTPKSKVRKSKYPAWFSNSLINMFKEKDRYYHKYKKYGNPRDFDVFSMLRQRCKVALDNCFNQYISRLEKNMTVDIKAFWRYTKAKRETNDLPRQMYYSEHTAECGQDIANLFARFFSSVYKRNDSSTYIPDFERSNMTLSAIYIDDKSIKTCLESINTGKGAGPDGNPPIFIKQCSPALIEPLSILFNKSLSNGYFPAVWKMAKIVPIHKAGDKKCVSNYRPISILNCFAKVFECLVYDYIYSHLKIVISPHQHGFIKSRSTATNLLSYMHYLSSTSDQSGQVYLLYIDFAKAFDRVDHTILCIKAEHLSIHGSLLRWLHSYLLNRTQLVTVSGYESSPFIAESGVPQGSNLGPLLFLMFMNDLLNKLKCECLAFADDIKIYRRIHSTADCIVLQSDIDILTRWCEENYMSLNIEKCQVITFTKKGISSRRRIWYREFS